MSDSVIEVANLSKRYRLGMVGSGTLRDTLSDFWNRHTRSVKTEPRNRRNGDFWALKDVSFDLARGEVLGIVGQNGAGKSTLLKILSRITEPTSGEARMRGKVSSLLEVGTGFHPELSGRENIYLNGAILGMRRAQISRRFDEIVAFADISQFLDSPVKHYSSGMYVRLAFAVAAHLEPDILVVDEILAVGDKRFQEKCIGKMHDIASSHERTVLFVSHNIANIRQLCTSAILLDGGRLIAQGRTEDVILAYTKSTEGDAARTTVGGNGVELRGARLVETATGEATLQPVFNRDYSLELVFEARTPVRDAMVLAEIEDGMGIVVSSMGTVEEGVNPFLMSGLATVRFQLGALSLVPGAFRIRARIFRWFENHPTLEVQNALAFEVQAAPIGAAIASYQRQYGMVRIARSVTVEQSSPVQS